jgi:hypothetical protein
MAKFRFGFLLLVFLTGAAFTRTGFIPEVETGVAVRSTATLAASSPGDMQGLQAIGTLLSPVASPYASSTPGAGDNPGPGGMPAITDRLARPALPANPSQADLGGQVYYYVCMACHGDQGQGLTPEWIDSWGLGKEQSCWQSKCHAANHPPEGFKLPKSIPPVVGPVIPARFGTALDLHEFLKAQMPWQAPGSLEDVEYWQLTAFLVEKNGIHLNGLALSEENAAGVRLRPEAPSTPMPAAPVGSAENRLGFWFGSAAIFGVVLLFGVLQIIKKWVRH